MIPFVPLSVPIDPSLPVAALAARGRWDAIAASGLIACVPARDEEGHIERCLDALDRELEPGDGVVVVANGCRDRTVPRAARRMSAWRRPWLLADCRWQPGHGSAPFARRLAFDLASGLNGGAILLSVDGDTVVLPGLRAAYGAEFAAGHDLVCGRIGFLAQEAAALPPAPAENEALVREYRETSRHIAALIAPDRDNPWPHHGNIGGANFAIAGAAYRRAGPLPTPASGEDRALRRRCEGLALRIRYSDGPCVETSCRLDGRAPGGLADELRRDRTEADPLVDELLEPPDRLLLRHRSRRHFLAAEGVGERAALLGALALTEDDAARLAARGDGLAWQEAEDLSPPLARERLRLSDLKRHITGLRLLLGTIREAPSGSPPSREEPAS